MQRYEHHPGEAEQERHKMMVAINVRDRRTPESGVDVLQQKEHGRQHCQNRKIASERAVLSVAIILKRRL